MNSLQIFRSAIYHCLGDPVLADSSGIGSAFEYFKDGILIIENGLISRIGPADELLKELPRDALITHFTDKLIIPGLIDSHTHYPQTDIIASYGKQLLDWLNEYTFPAEAKFANAVYAQQIADFFIQELFRNGTTTAVVMPTIHPESVDAIFNAAQKHNMCLISGKVMMDRNAPDFLTDTAESSYTQSKALIEKWHKQGRLHYAITPRFAPTSSEAQLTQAGLLATEHPDTYIHSHVAENKQEVEWVAKLFPQARSYLDVYEQYDLLRERSVYAHGIYLNDTDLQLIQKTGAAIAFCPTSNLFLGSGLLDLERLEANKVNVALATDVGGGTSFSLLQTLSEAYKIQQLQGNSFSAHQGFYMATLGSAKALFLDDKIGNFNKGKAADFVVLDYHATPLIKHRMQLTETRSDTPYENIAEKLFVLMMLGDDRVIDSTYIMGQCVYARGTA